MGLRPVRSARILPLAVLLLLLSAMPALAGPSAGEPDPVRVVSSDANGIVLDVVVPEYGVQVVSGNDGRNYLALSAPGLTADAAPGTPAVPATGRLLVVPPAADLALDVEVLDEETISLPLAIQPAPADAPALDPAALAEALGDPFVESFQPDAPAAEVGAVFEPAAPAQVVEVGYMRETRLARLALAPLQYRAADRTLRHIRHMRVTVRFTGSAGGAAVADAAVSADADPGGFGGLAQRSVINPEFVKAWRAAPDVHSPLAAPASPAADAPRYRITLRESGLYRLGYSDLRTAGVPVDTLDPRRLRISEGDVELAIEVAGEDDGRFDPGDQVLFYATAVDSLYTNINTLWLEIGATAGKRMAARSVTPGSGSPATAFESTVRFEEDRVYRSSLPMASDVDHWYWGQMYVISQTRMPTLTVPFTVEAPLTNSLASITLEMWGNSSDVRVNPDHHLIAYVNGTQVGEGWWDGAVQANLTFAFDPALLLPGENQLTLYTPGDTGARDALNRSWEANWLDGFDLRYSRAYTATGDRLRFTPPAGPATFAVSGWSLPDVLLYDITNPRAPVRLDGFTLGSGTAGFVVRFTDAAPAAAVYHAAGRNALLVPLGVSADRPSALRMESAPADYLLIAHADFMEGLAPLVQLRERQGLRVRVIDVQDIYDEFSRGLMDFHAIRDFIAYTYYNWPRPAPAYVLLVGDGTYDPMDREGTGVRTFIPPFLASVDPIVGETAADNRFVTVAGNDVVPDLHLGRLPVNSTAELAAMVTKIVAYEENPAPGEWRDRAVFLADNQDTAGDFSALSEEAVAYLPPEMAVQRIYLGSVDYPTSQAVRAQQAALDAFNNGALFFNYVGHSSISNWAAELLFGLTSIPRINNGAFYPVVLPMTCLEGSYHNPRFEGVAESITRLANRGALASWSPTGLGVASGHDYLHRGFYDAVFGWEVRELGPATAAGKLLLYTEAHFADGTPRFRDLMDTYVLLGDPATHIGLPDADLSISATGPVSPVGPDDVVTFSITYRNEASVRVRGAVITADLPESLLDLDWTATDPTLSVRPDTRFIWDVPEIAPGATEQVTITARIPAVIPADEQPLQAYVSITSRASEPNRDNNEAGPLTIDLLPVDLRIAQSVEPANVQVKPGDLVTFTLGYANLGPGAAHDVALELSLPVPLDELQVSQNGPVAVLRPGSQYTWALPLLLPGGKGRLVVSGRVPQTLTVEQLVWSIAGRIAVGSADEPGWPDANPADNVADTATIVINLGDAFEPDDSPAEALLLTVPSRSAPRTIDPAGDQDWCMFDAEAGVTYLVATYGLGGEGDTVLFLWSDAGKLLMKNDDAGPGTGFSRIVWTAPRGGRFYISVSSNGQSPDFSYGLRLNALSERSYLPIGIGN